MQTNNLGQTTYYVSGSFEEVRHSGGLIERKFYVHAPMGRVAVRIERNSGITETRWFHSDRLGSINAISDERGTIVQRFAYDAWGRRVNPANGAGITSSTNSGVTRGYTDHEHLDDLGLIHMNGRVYDPLLGRFLSCDPLVQDSGDSQSYNRYSYCANNPVNYSDPSGYSFISWISSAWNRVTNWISNAVGAVVGVFAGRGMGNALASVLDKLLDIPVLALGAASAFSGSLLNGASLGDAFRSAYTGIKTGIYNENDLRNLRKRAEVIIGQAEIIDDDVDKEGEVPRDRSAFTLDHSERAAQRFANFRSRSRRDRALASAVHREFAAKSDMLTRGAAFFEKAPDVAMMLDPSSFVRNGIAKTIAAKAARKGVHQRVKERMGAAEKASKIDRAAFKKEREAFWKAEANANPGKYTPDDLAKMQKGKPPTGADGHPIELHHVDRTPEGGVQPMTRTDHRLGENYKKKKGVKLCTLHSTGRRGAD